MRLLHIGDPEELRAHLNGLRAHWEALHLDTCNVVHLDAPARIAMQLANHDALYVLPHSHVVLKPIHVEALKSEGIEHGMTMHDALAVLHRKYGSHLLDPHLPL